MASAGSPHMRAHQSIWQLVAGLNAVRQRVAALDTNLNAHAVAQYEMHRAMQALHSFAQAGDRPALDSTRERFRRMLVQLAPDDKRDLVQQVALIIEAAEVLTETERRTLATDLAGRLRSQDAGEPSTTAPQPPLLGDEIEFIRDVMTGLPGGLARWTWEVVGGTRKHEGRRWHIDNEIHVQNLLWLALAPTLPGLKCEETLPSIGRISPRVDLALPQLNLAIETKFMRRPTDDKRVTEEIAADSALYTAAHNGPYSRLMVLVWDNTRSTERHRHLEDGLKTLRGVVDAIVVSRPGRMGSATS